MSYGNVVETTLARALVLAAEAQRWELVAQIANGAGSAASDEGRTREGTVSIENSFTIPAA